MRRSGMGGCGDQVQREVGWPQRDSGGSSHPPFVARQVNAVIHREGAEGI